MNLVDHWVLASVVGVAATLVAACIWLGVVGAITALVLAYVWKDD